MQKVYYRSLSGRNKELMSTVMDKQLDVAPPLDDRTRDNAKYLQLDATKVMSPL